MLHRILIAFLLACPVLALDVVVEPNARITKDLFFVLDKSCSMSGRLNKAIDATLEIACQETDELNIAVLAFSQDTVRWPGKPKTEPDGGPPAGWATMPSKETRTALSDWLNALQSRGTTPVLPALQEALAATAPKNKKLTVILISDGGFAENEEVILAEMERLQLLRSQKKQEKAVIVCYGIDSRGDKDLMLEIAKHAKANELLGGYFVETTPPVVEPDPDPPFFWPR